MGFPVQKGVGIRARSLRPTCRHPDTREGTVPLSLSLSLSLSHAALQVSGVPAASSGAMLLAGLLSVGWLASRRR